MKTQLQTVADALDALFTSSLRAAIRVEMARLGINQTRLAKELRVQPSTLSVLLRGEAGQRKRPAHISAAHLRQMAEALATQPSALMAEAERIYSRMRRKDPLFVLAATLEPADPRRVAYAVGW